MWDNNNAKKNGEIELLRFVFAMVIVIYHFNNSFQMGIFSGGGKTGVDFFFLVTGVLMATSTKKIKIEKNKIPDYTYRALWRKIVTFYPFYLTSILFSLLFLKIIVQKKTIGYIIINTVLSLPRILLFDSAGFVFGGDIKLAVDWYLSTMILSFFILYPILLYSYEWASKYIFPIVGIFGLGVIFINYGYFINGKMIFSMFDTRMLRGLFEMMLGVWGYEMSQKLREIQLTKLSKILLTIFKWCCFAMVLIYMYGSFHESISVIAFVLCILGIILCFSENTYNIKYNWVMAYMGKLSLPLYLSHIIIRNICNEIFAINIEKWKIAIAILICPLFAHIVMVVTEIWVKWIKSKKELFVK